MPAPWTTDDIPDLSGKIAIVTGANSGIGYETAKALAAKHATVVMACRNMEKAAAARDAILSDVPDARLDVIQLDLAGLASVKAFAEAFEGRYSQLDLLINNAGLMVPPLSRTQDGFEAQFGVNHLGHFALTMHLMDRLLATPGARVVNVSSNMHRMGKGTIDFENLNAENGYRAAAAYAQSKLANLLFTLELNRRLAAMGADVIATAAHPGWTATGLQRGIVHAISKAVAQTPPMGALPTLRAAVDPDAQRGDYYGPGGWMEIRGYPEEVTTSDAAQDAALAKRLWAVSEDMTGTRYPWPA